MLQSGRRGGIRFEGSDNGWRGQEMLDATGNIKTKSLVKACALLTDGRFSGTSGLFIGQVSPAAAEGGVIALVNTGDMIDIDIDIPNRTISLRVDDAVLVTRRSGLEASGFKLVEKRKRNVTNALKAYAALTTSAAKGAVRRVLD